MHFCFLVPARERYPDSHWLAVAVVVIILSQGLGWDGDWEFEYATTDIRGLTHDKSELREWLWTVPPPAAIEPGHVLEIVEVTTPAPVAHEPATSLVDPVQTPLVQEPGPIAPEVVE